MHKQIFVNLPVADLDRSVAFFNAMGYPINPEFTNGDAACVIISEHICVMLLTGSFFASFTTKPICDANSATEVILCLSCESRAEVDGQLAKAVAAGASVPRPAQDHGFMYSQAFEDLDGHIWELVFMELPA